MDESLPTPPPLTEKLLAKNAQEQKMRARRFKDSISAGNNKYARASAIIKETEAIIGEIKTLKAQKAALTVIQIERYAIALAQVGDFKTAAQFDSTKGYKEIDKAVWRADTDTCKCSPTRVRNQEGELETYSPQFVQQVIRSVKHNKEVNLYRCNTCGFLNAK